MNIENQIEELKEENFELKFNLERAVNEIIDLNMVIQNLLNGVNNEKEDG